MDCYYKYNCNGRDCEKFCQRKYKLDFLYNEALLTDSQKVRFALKIDADGTDLEAFKRLQNIEQNILTFIDEKQNLYIHSSNCGNGKSSWAIRMIQSYFDAIWPITELTCRALFISVPKFLLASKDKITAKNDYFDHIKKYYLSADLVIWDDIATSNATDYEMSQLLSMIDARLVAGKTNIFTSNLSPKQMSKALGERLASRVCTKSVDIELFGSDKRNLQSVESRKW